MDVPSYFIFYVQKIEYPRMIYSQYTLTFITVELQKVTLGIKHSSEKVRSKTATLDNENCGVFECEACFNNPKQDNKQKLIHIEIGAVQDSEVDIGSIDLDLEDIDKHKSKLAIKKIRFGKHQKGKLYYRAIVLPITFFPHGKPIDFFASVPINNTKDDILTNLALTQTLTESVYDEVHENFVQSNDHKVTSLSKFTKSFEPKSSNSSSQQHQPTPARDTQRISSIKKLTKHMVRPDEGDDETNPENVQIAEKVVEIDHSPEELKEMMKHTKKKLVSAMVAQFTAKFSLIVFQKIVCADLFAEDISQDLIAPVLEFNLLSAPKISSDQLIYALMPLFSAIHITLKRRSEVVPLFTLLSSLINFGILLTSEAEYYTTSHVPVMASLEGHISILISQLSCFLYGPLVSSMTNDPLEAMTSQSAADLSNILQQFFTVAKTYVKSKYIMKLLIDRTCSLTDEVVSNCLIQFSQIFNEEQCANLRKKIEKLKEYFSYNVKDIPVNFPHMQQIISKRNRNVQRIESAKDEDVIFSFDELRRIAIDDEGKHSTQSK